MVVTRRAAGAATHTQEEARLPPDVPTPAGGRGVRAERRQLPAAIPPFQSFLEEHRIMVYRFLMGSVGPNEADDCFQETFLAALRAYPKLRNGDNLRGWILAIATRKAIDAARARNKRAEPVADMTGLPPDQAGQSLEVEFEGFNGSIDEPLWSEILALPPMQRVALVHRVLLDRPYAELAAAMGCSVVSARANVYQALKKLREAWTNHERD
jgi:RNA polymerase sigma factor (sigma-70 family)